MSKKSFRIKVFSLYYEGKTIREISDELDVSEYEVVKILRPRGY